MIGITRLYLESRPEQPEHMQHEWIPVVIDCPTRDIARSVGKKYRSQGYDVLLLDI